jgi:hypothetical protein
MNNIITVEDLVLPNGVRRLHWMSNDPITLRLTDGALLQSMAENDGAHHLRAEFPVAGLVDVQLDGWLVWRRLVMWSMRQGGDTPMRMRDAICKAAEVCADHMGGVPNYAFTRSLPRGIDDGTVVDFRGREILLFSAEWVPEACVAVVGMGEDPSFSE